MCVGNNRQKEPAKKEPEEEPTPPPVPEEDNQQDYAQMFIGLEAQLVQYRAQLRQRLMQDPFYQLMNVSSASRIWMLRHLNMLTMHAEQHYGMTLLQFFERMNRQTVFFFLRHKNAPNEMIEQWDKSHPTDGFVYIPPGPNRNS